MDRDESIFGFKFQLDNPQYYKAIVMNAIVIKSLVLHTNDKKKFRDNKVIN